MTTALTILIGLIIVMTVYFFILGHISRSRRALGLDGGKLARCANKPNCVCSEYGDDTTHFVPALKVGDHVDAALVTIKTIIQDQGGTLQVEESNYLAFTFTSSLFGFVDDVEVRLDAEARLLHIRSASRVGHSDLGVNKKRIEAIRNALEKALR